VVMAFIRPVSEGAPTFEPQIPGYNRSRDHERITDRDRALHRRMAPTPRTVARTTCTYTRSPRHPPASAAPNGTCAGRLLRRTAPASGGARADRARDPSARPSPDPASVHAHREQVGDQEDAEA